MNRRNRKLREQREEEKTKQGSLGARPLWHTLARTAAAEVKGLLQAGLLCDRLALDSNCR